jgi:hypothetical protein
VFYSVFGGTAKQVTADSGLNSAFERDALSTSGGGLLLDHQMEPTQMVRSRMPLRLAVFRYVISHFESLRNQWLLTQLFDAALVGVTVVTAPKVTIAIARITRQLLDWPDVTRSRHRLGGRQFNRRDIEMGHIHSNGVVDIRLSRSEHDEVIRRQLARPHHVAPQSSWVTYYLAGTNDTERVVELFRIPFQRLANGNPASMDAPTDELGD